VSLSSEQFAERQIRQAATRKRLMMEGYAQMSPAMGEAVYVRGDEYLDRNGEPCEATEQVEAREDGVVDDNELATLRREAAEGLTLGEVMKILMGNDIKQDLLVRALSETTAADALSEYTVPEVTEYIESHDVDVKSNLKRAEVLALVDTMHATDEG